MKQILLLYLLILLSPNTDAQYVYVTHTSGTQQIGGVNVTVTAINGPTTLAPIYCGLSVPYLIGTGANPANAYLFAFSHAITRVKLRMAGSNQNEIMSFYINGIHYNLSTANLSSVGGTCSYPNYTIVNGDIQVGNLVEQGAVSINALIDSIRIQHGTYSGAGTAFDFSFGPDSLVYLTHPFNDTALCVGDTLKIKYGVTSRLSPGNIFTAQLSDSSGSFSLPAILGTINSDTDSIFRWIVPSTIIQGTHYRVRVISTNAARISDTSKYIKIYKGPAGLIAGSNSAICLDDTLKLISSSTTSGAGYLWTGPGSFTSSSQNVNINPFAAVSGNYVVTASANGCSSKDTIVVVIKPLPVSALLAGSNSDVCTNDSLKLISANTLPGSSYSWSGPNSFSSGSQKPFIANPSLAYSGKYYVTAALNGCSVIDSTIVTVKQAPAQVAAASNSPVCPGDTLFLTSNAITNVSYVWTGPGSFLSNLQNDYRTHIGASDGGKYYLTVTAANGCFTKDSVTVSVYPVTPIPVASSNSPVCIGGFINLTATNVPSAILWNWTGPNNFTSNSQNPTKANAIATDVGIYSVKVTAANGCVSQPATTSVSIIQGPAVSVYASPKDTICAGNNMALVALPFGLGSNTPSYEWYRNNSFTGNTGGSLISAVVNNGDVFYVSMIANGSVCNTPILSNKVTMAVLPATPPPSVTISATPGTNIWPGLNVNFTSGNLTHGGNHPGYQWLLNGHNITGATNANWGSTTLNNNDTVCLLITSSEQCATPKTASSNCIEMNIATGIDKTGVETLKLYPNPNNGVFTLETAEKGMLHIYNLQGQHIAEYDISTAKTNIQLPVLSNGIYIARFTRTDNKTTITKITVQQ